MKNSSKNYVVGLGEVLWDVLPTGRKLGGAPANFAYQAGQFGFHSVVVSAIGEDSLGDETLQRLDEKHLDYVLPRVSFPTGEVLVSLDAAGIPSYNIKEGVAWDNIPFTAEMKQVAGDCALVCWGTLAQRSMSSRESISRFLEHVPPSCLKVYDINLRQHYFSKELIEDNLYRCNILKLNEDELPIVQRMLHVEANHPEQVCRLLMHVYRINIIVLTFGAQGSSVYTSKESSFLPTPKVDVVDTVGAGDSFTAAFCASLLRGKSIQEAHRRAVDVSAYVCTQNGAMPILPSSFTL